MAQYSRKLSKGIRWWYKFDYKSKTFISECIYLSKNEAKKAENSRYEEVSNQFRNPTEKPILGLLKIINERLDLIKIKKSKKYYNENKRYLSLLLNHVGDVAIHTIQRGDIEKLLLVSSERLQKKDMDNYSVNAMIRCYKALFNYVINNYEGLEMKNPVRRIDFYSIEKKLKYIPTEEEITSVINICDEDQRRLILFIEVTGARINECLHLKGADVLDNEVVLHTRKSKNSNRVPRKLPRPNCLDGIHFEPDELVFGKWKEQPKFLERKIKQLHQNPWGFHNLRHRRASMWSKQGKPIFEIMCLLGHSNISTTQRYLQLL